MPAPVNTTALTATLITAFPFTETIDVVDAPNNHEVWYAWDVDQNDAMHAFNADAVASGGGSVLEVILYIYRGTAANPQLVISTENTGGRNFIQYAEVPQERRWLRITTETTGTLSGVSLTVSGIEASQAPMDPGSVVILSDALQGISDPGVMLNASGTVARSINTVLGETAGILANGMLAVNDSANDEIVLYDTTKGFLKTATYTVPATSTLTVGLVGIAPIEPNQFAIIYGPFAAGGLAIRIIDHFGVEVRNLGSVGDVGAAVSPGNFAVVDDVGYYAGLSGSATAIRRVNMLTGAGLSDFLPANPSDINQNLLGLPDNTLLVGYSSGIQRYHPNGTLLNDYATFDADIAAGWELNHIAVNWNDPTTFYARFMYNLSNQFIAQVNIATGVEVPGSRFYNPVANGGAPATNPGYASPFGMNASCPFEVLTQTVPRTLTTPPISTPCCCACPEPAGPTTPPGPGITGNVTPPEEEEIFSLFPQCVGGGLTPSEPPLFDSEVYV